MRNTWKKLAFFLATPSNINEVVSGFDSGR
jgi:hypothetical protein